jgi:TP901 family phage tail tape measure protein
MAQKQLSAVIQIGGAVSSTLGRAFGAVRGETIKVGEAVSKLTARQRELGNVIKQQEALGRNASALKVQYANQELVLIGRQIEALKRRQAVEQRITDNQAQRANLRGQIGEAVAVGAAVLGPLGAAIKSSASFNYELALIGNTANLTRTQVTALGADIQAVARDTGNATTDVLGAMKFLVAAGMDAMTAGQALRGIGKTATATGSNIEDVAKATFTLGDALKVNPGQMQKALDALVQAGKEGNFEFKDMAAELPVLGAAMQSLKLTGTDAVATLGAALQIARKGAGGSAQAATNLENFLVKLASPETLKKARENFGVDLYQIITDAQSKGQNPFEAALAEINRMTKGGDQKLLGELFGDMQVQGFLRPMLQNLDEYNRIKRAALEADGVVDRDLPAILGQTQKQLEATGDAFRQLGIAIGAALAPAVGMVVGVLVPAIQGVTSFVNENSKLVGSIGAVGAALAAGRIGFLVIKYGALLASRAVLALGAAMLANPIGLGIRLIAGGAALIVMHWEPIKGFFANLWGEVKATFASVYDWIVGKVAYLMEIPGRIKDKVGGALGIGSYAKPPTGGTMDGFEPPGAGLPDVPAVASRGSSVTNNVTHSPTYNITQQPGQSAKELADEIDRLQRRRAGVMGRSSLLDGMGAQ